MSTFETFESQRISLAEHSCSSFALVYLLCAGEDFSPSVMPMRATSGKFRPMRVGFHTGTRRLRVAEEGILL
jgi:hypothetical protein